MKRRTASEPVPWRHDTVYRGADLTGQRFARLTVIERVGRDERGFIVWRCQCDCGNEITPRTGRLTNGVTKSCGCFKRDIAHARVTTRPFRKTREYKSWINMRSRCANSNLREWKHYGGRGITVCERWQSFKNFYADMGPAPTGMTLDRIDVNGNYDPSNCRWATDVEQARNTRANRLLTFDGQTQPMAAWAEEYGVNYHTLAGRLGRGLPLPVALGIGGVR